MATAVNVNATNNAEIDGLLSGVKWSGTITYSFPDAASDYASPYSGGSSEPTTSGFASAPSQMQTAINYAIGLINGYTNASIHYNGTGSADIMIAQSPSANPTSYAYYPSNYASGGDVWFGTKYNYSLAQLGNYYFTTALHELGHAFGLKHSQETGGPADVAVPSAHDDSEYTVMSYRSYVGASTSTGYTNEAYGYPQTYMANDILALQTMYGANYTTQSGSTVYTWSPTTGQEFINGVGQLAPGGGTGGSANRIYETVWDGGGVDTYDLSNYTTNLSINLNPGASSVFSTVQLANLGDGHYASGNVYNAYLYNGDVRSYIDNATGGSGNDTVLGNAIANVLNGGFGNDTITGGGGNDTIVGGAGTDTAVYSGNAANYAISYNSATQTYTLVDQRSASPDGTDTVTGMEYLQFADGTRASSAFATAIVELSGATELVQSGNTYLLNSVGGSTGPSLKYSGAAVTSGQFSPFVVIAAELTATGYEIAWKYAAGDQFSIWNTDASGNFQSYAVYSSSSSALQSLETSFHQDLNGDGVIGIPGQTVLESSGTTALVQSGANYFFNPVVGGSGPELKFQGANVTDGQFSPFVPVAVEQLSGGGYQLAWKYAAADQFSIWNVDANGNYVSYAVYSANSIALETLETSFHQDLNGDGTTGFPGGTPLETAGATALVQSGSNFLFYPSAGGAGTLLKFQGAAVSSGHFAPFVPVGVEQTSSGYQLAWRDPGTNQFSIWTTDANGNYQSYTVYSSTSSGLKALETSFHQDLNGDGVTGPSPVQPLNTSRLDNFLFKATGSVDAAAAYQHLDSLAAGVGSHDVLQVTLDTFVQAGANDLNIGTTDIADWARHFLESHAGDLFAR